MKQLLYNKKYIAIFIAFIAVFIVSAYFINSLFGNPFSKANAEKNIKAYIVDTYGVIDFILTDVEYNAEIEEYCTTVTFKDSSDIVFDISYSVSKTKITDSYDSVVANGLNTFVRLNSEYGKRVTEVLQKHYTDKSIMCYGELGKNQSLSHCGEKLTVDMDFDMYNLPLEATVSVFLNREDTSAQQFAKDLTALQKIMYANEIAVDYYDVMYNSNVLLEDFPSLIVTEYLEDTTALAQYIEQFIN